LPATSFNMVADSLIFLKTIIHIIDITLLWARLYFLLFSICCPGSCSGHNIVPSRSCWHAEFICSKNSHIWAKWSAKWKWSYLRWAQKRKDILEVVQDRLYVLHQIRRDKRDESPNALHCFKAHEVSPQLAESDHLTVGSKWISENSKFRHR
jgi:hypothetical protein